MSKEITLVTIPEGFKVRYFQGGNQKDKECYRTIERAMDRVMNFFKEPDIPPSGDYHVTVTRCVPGTAANGREYWTAELKVTSGTWKNQVFFVPLTGGFNIRVVNEHYENIVRNKVTEIHQNSLIKDYEK